MKRISMQTFFRRIEAYYGGYPEGQKPVVAAYLKSKHERYLAHLLECAIYGFSSKWNRPPDVAIFEGFRDQVMERIRAENMEKRPRLPDPDDGEDYVEIDARDLLRRIMEKASEERERTREESDRVMQERKQKTCSKKADAEEIERRRELLRKQAEQLRREDEEG